MNFECCDQHLYPECSRGYNLRVLCFVQTGLYWRRADAYVLEWGYLWISWPDFQVSPALICVIWSGAGWCYVISHYLQLLVTLPAQSSSVWSLIFFGLLIRLQTCCFETQTSPNGNTFFLCSLSFCFLFFFISISISLIWKCCGVGSPLMRENNETNKSIWVILQSIICTVHQKRKFVHRTHRK